MRKSRKEQLQAEGLCGGLRHQHQEFGRFHLHWRMVDRNVKVTLVIKFQFLFLGGVSTTLSTGRGVPGSCVAALGQRKLRAGAGRGQPVLGIGTNTALCGACRGEYQQQAHEQVAAWVKATDQCPRMPSALALQ